jgi:hypothetical protein
MKLRQEIQGLCETTAKTGAIRRSKSHPIEVRKRAHSLFAQGQKVAEISSVLQVSKHTIYNWTRRSSSKREREVVQAPFKVLKVRRDRSIKALSRSLPQKSSIVSIYSPNGYRMEFSSNCLEIITAFFGG